MNTSNCFRTYKDCQRGPCLQCAGYGESCQGMIRYAHGQGVPVLVDGAQSIPHMPVNVQDLDADFYVFPVIRYMALPVWVCSMVRKNGLRRYLPIKVAAK